MDNTDGGCGAPAFTTVTADMRAYGGSATGALTCNDPGDDGIDVNFSNEFEVFDAGAINYIDVGPGAEESKVDVTASDSDDESVTGNTNTLGAGVDVAGATNGADTLAPEVETTRTYAFDDLCTGTLSGGLPTCIVGDVIRFYWVGNNPMPQNFDVETVVADLSPFGGSATQTMYDDETNGDSTGGDDIYTYFLTVPEDDDDGEVETFTVTATDDAGNFHRQENSDGTYIIIDNVPPVIGAAGVVSMEDDVNADGIASIDDIIRYTAGTESTGDTLGGPWTVDLSFGPGPGPPPWSEPPSIITVYAGTDNNVVFSTTETVTDDGGNSTSGSVTVTGFTKIDNVVPAAPSTPDLSATSDTGALDTDDLTNDDTPTFTGTAEENATVTIVSNVDGIVGSGTAAGGSYSITATTLTEGPHTITAYATDTAANVGATPSGISITIDTTPPAFTSALMEDGNTDGYIDRLALDFDENLADTASGANGFDVTSAANHGSCTGESADPDGTSSLNLDFACDIQYTAVGDLTLTFATNAGLLDTAGNQVDSDVLDYLPAPPPYIADNAAPVITSTEPADAAINISRTDDVVINFSEAMNVAVGTLSDDDTDNYTLLTWSNGDIRLTGVHTTWSPQTIVTVTLSGAAASSGSILPLTGSNSWNFSTAAASRTRLFPPTGSISINEGDDSTIDASVMVYITSSDATEIILSENSNFVGFNYQPIAGALPFILSEGSGIKTVYAYLRGDGGVSMLLSDTIEFVDLSQAPTTTEFMGETPPEDDSAGEPSPDDGAPETSTPSQPAPDETTSQETTEEEVGIGDLLKAADGKTVYFIGPNLEKHVFPNEKVYFSWYHDFSGIQRVSPEILNEIPLGRNMIMRPGTWLITTPETSRVYAVEPTGIIRWLETEEITEALYGPQWRGLVADIAIEVLENYREGASINSLAHPTGTLIKYENSNEVYYIEKGLKRYVSVNAYNNSRFNGRFIISDTPASNIYLNGDSFPEDGEHWLQIATENVINFVGNRDPVTSLPEGIAPGDIVKSSSNGLSYYIGQDNRSHLYPNERVFLSWNSDRSNVKEVSAEVLETITFGDNATLHPGSYLVKVRTNNNIYSIIDHQLLSKVTSVEAATIEYGEDWEILIEEINITLFENYVTQ